MAADKQDNPYGLTPEEQKILKLWQEGCGITSAYKKVMLTQYEIDRISDSALYTRATRFCQTFRMLEAMANTPGERGERVRKKLAKWNAEQLKAEEEAKKKAGLIDDDAEDDNESGTDLFGDMPHRKPKKSDQEKWLDSLKIKEDPSALTIYGTGQFLAKVAVQEIVDRQKEIKRQNISVLSRDGRGSALTPTIVSALKTAASMVLPFAPAPTAKDRKELTKAAILLGLVPDNIKESPDDYTAPPPATVVIDVEPEDLNDKESEE